MQVVDTCGWIEWLTEGTLAENFADALLDTTELVVSSIIQFELYKWCLREQGEAAALEIIGITETCKIWKVDTQIALSAADLSVRYKLAMADALVYATAIASNSHLLTCDAHFAELPNVTYWKKPGCAP